MQYVLVLIGLPGSGKSTVARLFQQEGWQVINQDTLGDRKQCEAACWAALSAGRNVVIDRCNHNMDQRRHWLTIAQQQRQARGPIQVLALCLELPVALCLERAQGRGQHATLPATMAAEVIERFKNEWQRPQQREGFHAVLVAHSSEEATTRAAQLLQQTAVAAAVGGGGGGGGGGGLEVEEAVPLRAPAAAPAWHNSGGGAAAAHLSAAAQPFQPGMSWQPAAPAAPALMQQAQQHGWVQQPWPPQQRPEQQWHHPQRTYSSRADAADSWRRRDGDSQDQQPGTQQQREQQQQQHHGRGHDPGSNIVPFPQRRQPRHHPHHPPHPQHPRRHPWQRHGHEEPSGMLLDAEPSDKIILMFDANGCITSHTSMRRSVGMHQTRPGIHHLRRLQAHYRIGMFSSASRKTVDTSLSMLEEAAGPGDPPLFDPKLVLCRSHTMLAPLVHLEAGGKDWDTVKPLRPYFSRLHRVLLIDDDSFKAVRGEEGNMLLMPRWEGDDPQDTVVGMLVDVLLQLAEQMGGDPDADVRAFTQEASARLAALAAAAAQERAAAAAAQHDAQAAVGGPESATELAAGHAGEPVAEAAAEAAAQPAALPAAESEPAAVAEPEKEPALSA